MTRKFTKTKTAYFIRPEGFPREIRISKSELRVTGFKPQYGVSFRIA